MKTIVVLTIFFLLIAPITTKAADDEVTISCEKRGAEMYLFSFRKALGRKEFCGSIDKPSAKHAMASEIVETEGVYKVISVEEYEFMLVKGTAFSAEEIGKELEPIIAKYLKVKKVTIVYK